MNPPEKAPHVLHAPSLEQVTEAHIENALAVVGALHPFLFPPVDRSDPIPRTQELDGEAKIAAVTTFVKACTRLDALLDDPERWVTSAHKNIYTAMNACYAQQFEFLKSQTYAANQICRPFFLLKPDLAQIEDKSYIAYWGDISTPGAGLVGRGATPAAAFSDFDAAYYRQDQIRIEAPEETPPPKSRSKKK